MARTITSGDFSFDVITDWVKVKPDARAGRATHGVQVLPDQRIVVFHQNEPGDPALLYFDVDGKRLDGRSDYPDAHGLTLARDSLWITSVVPAKVEKLSLDGEVLLSLAPPPQELLNDQADEKRRHYKPTWVDQSSDGTIWVADGYGTHRVYRYDGDGNYVGFIDGTEGAGRFNEPHGLRISPDNELWITDRSNRRVCVYTVDGSYLRHSDTACHSPAAFAFHDSLIYVAEIAGSVKILDPELNVLADLGQSPDIVPLTRDADSGWVPKASQRPEGWPDVPEEKLPLGHFHTPHGIDVDAAGNIYVAEWYTGGRVMKLIRQ